MRPLPGHRVIVVLDRIGLCLSGTACCVIVVMVTSGIVMRALGRPLLFADEYSTYLMAAVAFLALSAVTRDREHIAAEFLVLMTGPRTRLKFRLLSDAALFIYAVVLFAISVRLMAVSYFEGLRSQGLMNTPIYIPQTAMVLGLGAMVLRGGLEVIETARNLLAGEPSAGHEDQAR